jgi:hypothetical protein
LKCSSLVLSTLMYEDLLTSYLVQFYNVCSVLFQICHFTFLNVSSFLKFVIFFFLNLVSTVISKSMFDILMPTVSGALFLLPTVLPGS